MKTVTVTNAKAHLSRLLGLVRRGETILILHRGNPIARLEPVTQMVEGLEQERLERLERAGILRHAHVAPPGRLPVPKAALPDSRSLLSALLEEREEGR